MNINPTKKPFAMTLTEILKDFEPQEGAGGPACAILGPNPMRFPWGFDEEDEDCVELKQVLNKEILYLSFSGIEKFWIACDPGVGLWCGEFINRIEDDFMLDMGLYCQVPYEEHANKWYPDLRDRYFNMLMLSVCEDRVTAHKTPTSHVDAYRAIIDKSDVILVVHDDDFKKDDALDTAIQYAQSLMKPMIIVHPVTLDITTIV